MLSYRIVDKPSTNKDYHNICKIGRTRAGMTQEQWAEACGISVRSVGDYEAMVKLPSEAAAVKMAEVARMPVLCYWHMRQALGYSSDILPAVEQLSLPQAVVNLLKQLRDLERRSVTDQLLDMADDGVIDLSERPNFDAILLELQDVIQAVNLLTYADTEGEL